MYESTLFKLITNGMNTISDILSFTLTHTNSNSVNRRGGKYIGFPLLKFPLNTSPASSAIKNVAKFYSVYYTAPGIKTCNVRTNNAAESEARTDEEKKNNTHTLTHTHTLYLVKVKMQNRRGESETLRGKFGFRGARKMFSRLPHCHEEGKETTTG